MLLKTITVFSAILLVSSFGSMALADKTTIPSIDNPKTRDGNSGYKPDRLNISENVAVTVHHKHVDTNGNTITETAVYTSLNQNSLDIIKQNSDTKTTMDRIWNLDRVRFNGRSIVSENALWNYIFAEKLSSLIKAELYNDKQTNNLNNFVIEPNKISNQGTIHITSALQLDSNRYFLKDVYPQVHAKDGNWTGYIPVGNYIRVTFEKDLTGSNDVTIFAKSNYSNASIQLYEKDSNRLLAEFGKITQEKQYRIFLTNLNGTQDTFDLKIVGSPIDFDYVVDPAFSVTHSDTVELSTKASPGKAVKDSVAISESVKLPQKKVSDTISLSDKEATSRQAKDSVAISDSLKLPQKQVTDSLLPSEKATPNRVAKDVVAISESTTVSTAIFHPVLVTDTISISEKTTPNNVVKDVVAISDSVKLPQKQVSDTISISEKTTPNNVVKDVIAISDSAAGNRGTFASLSDSVAVNDGTVSTNATKSVTISETITPTDQLANSLSKSMTESIGTDDGTVFTSKLNSISLRESISIDDGTVSLSGLNSVTLSESIAVDDGTVSLSGLNSVTLTETITMTPQITNAKSQTLSENLITDDVIGENLAPNQNLVSNIQQTITVDPVKTDLVISSSNASLSTVTVPSTTTTTELNYSKIVQSGITDTVQINNPLTITKDTNGDSQPDVQVSLPANVTVGGPTTWIGIINLPTVVSNPTLPQEQNTINTPSKSIELGFGSTTLTFDKAVRISFIGDAGKRVGYFNSVTPFTEIITTCSSDTQIANNGLPSGGNCKINVGSDLVVWTKHFTGFATFGSSSPGSGGTGGNSGGGGAGATSAGPSGAGGGAAGLGGQLIPYLSIQQVYYDVCDLKTVKIVVATDNSKVPTVIIRSSVSGITDAQLAQDQPYAQQNVNATIKTLLYEGQIDSNQKSFEVLALTAIGNNVYSEGKTIEVTGCHDTINFVNELSTQPTQIDSSAPKIFDTKFQIGNATKVLSSDVTDQYVDNLSMSIYSIIYSPTPLDRAELRYVTLGQDMANYAVVKMDVVPLPVTNSTYIISGTIPLQFMKSPAIQYWIHVENHARKVSDSEQYSVGVKPGYPINGNLELDIIKNNAAGIMVTSDAYFTNNSTRPVFGAISLVVDGNQVYTSTPQLFELGQTLVQLKWKTTGYLTTHQLQARAEFYGTLIESKIQIENTFQSTQTISLLQPKIIGPVTSQDGNTIAIPVVIHSSFNNAGHMKYRVTAPDGTCVIGDSGCLVTNSTYHLPGQVKSITIGDQIYRVRFSGSESSLERFSIRSIDPIIGQWNIQIYSQDGQVQQTDVMQHTFLQIKYKPQSSVLP